MLDHLTAQSDRTAVRSLMISGALAAATLLGGCGSAAPDAAGEEPTASAEAGAESDLEDPGDDLLDRTRRGVELVGLEQRVTWRFPEGYEVTSGREASLTDGGTTFGLTVGAKPGVEQGEEGRSFTEEAPEGAETAVEDVTIAGETFTLATFDEPTTSLRAYFYTPDDEDATYAVFLRSGTSLEDTPPERLEEVQQMVASLELEPKKGLDP